LVAYVKKSGVDQLASSIERFREAGGHVNAVVGVGQKNTSVQGLQHLLPLCDEIVVYQNESPTSTFHLKVYIFERTGERAIVFVGSSNLTAGGLYTNYEVNSYSEYDLKDPTQATKFLMARKMFDTYSTPSEFSKKLTPELLQELYTEGYLSNEETDSQVILGGIEKGEDKRKRIFGSKRINPPLIAKTETTIQIPLIDFEQIQDQWAMKGKLLWRKQLTPRDLQIVSIRTAPTGGLSLTQADWRVGGKVIDQTVYFKEKIFGNFDWKRDRAKSEAVATKVLFNVRIMGEDLGQHQLMLRHNPKWESEQHNYTTSISWGDLTKSIRNRTLIDRTFALYAPPMGKKKPFYIEIS